MSLLVCQTLPKYVSISEDLRRQIIDGKLLPGTRLEAQSKLAQKYGVSLLTARQALGKLEEEGFIKPRHGQGTFVVDNADTSSDLNLSSSIGLLMIDNTVNTTRTNTYCMTLIREIGDVLSRADRDLKVATVTDAAFKQGRPHGMLDRRRVRAVIVDGYVSQLHVDLIRELGVDMLLVGNHAVADDIPQVRHNVRQAAYGISKAMIALDHGPVILFTEPYRYHYTTEMVLGYQQAMYESKQYPIAFSAQADAMEIWDRITEMIARQHANRFCVMSMLRVTDAILERCKVTQLDVRRVPTCIVGNPHIDHEELQPWVVGCEMSAIELGRAVGESLVKALDSGKPIGGCTFEPVIDTGAHSDPGSGVWSIRCDWQPRFDC